MPQTVLVPQTVEVPQTVDVPQTVLAGAKTLVPQTVEVPQTVDVPQTVERPEAAFASVSLRYTFPVAGSSTAVGDAALPVARFVSFNAAQTSNILRQW